MDMDSAPPMPEYHDWIASRCPWCTVVAALDRNVSGVYLCPCTKASVMSIVGHELRWSYHNEAVL